MQSRTWAAVKAFVLQLLFICTVLGNGAVAATGGVTHSSRVPAASKPKIKPRSERPSLLKRLGFGSLIRGRLVYGLWLPTRLPEGQTEYQLRQSQLSAWLESDPRLSDSWSLHGRGTLDGILQSTLFTTTERVGRGIRATFREGYLQFANSGWDFRAGRQLILWGKSDGINPTDFLSAKRQYLLYSEEESRRVGSDSVSVNFVPSGGASPWGFTAIWNPIYSRSDALLTEKLISSGVEVFEGAYSSDPVSADLGEWAGRISYFGDGYDFDLVGFRGRRRLPQFTAVTSGIESRYERIQAAGMNFSFNLGDWMFRAEGAAIEQISSGLYQPLIQPRWIETVLGAERAFQSRFRLQLQWLYRRFLRFKESDPVPDPTLMTLRRTNALIQGMLYAQRHGATFRLSYEPEDSDLSAEVFMLSWLAPAEGLLQPKLTLKLRDSLKLVLGMSLFFGPGDQAFGALTEYGSYFGELRYFF